MMQIILQEEFREAFVFTRILSPKQRGFSSSTAKIFATPYRAWLYISQLLLGITLLYEENIYETQKVYGH